MRVNSFTKSQLGECIDDRGKEIENRSKMFRVEPIETESIAERRSEANERGLDVRYKATEKERERERPGNIMRVVYRGTSELLLQNLPAYLHSPAANTDRN